MVEVRFRAYREYVAKRVDVNNAMMAMLAGSQLAAHMLQLTSGSTLTLSELFPAVPYVRRFNLRNDYACQFLGSADAHLASVAIPYALATHEAFVMDMLELLETFGFSLTKQIDKVRAKNMHSVFFKSTNTQEPASQLEIFDVLRETRNCIIHNQGRVDGKLQQAIDELSAPATSGWKHLNAGQSPEQLVGEDGLIKLTAEHIFTAFANTKSLGRAINSSLLAALPKSAWAKIAVDDFSQSTSKLTNSSQWRRSVCGYVRQYYSAANLNTAEIESAARSLGLWTGGAWQ